ncbi:hypothetical protein BU14_0930s0005 [Porphyra umbilicalis]|uniref:6-pyruvoyltetrahydropterin synthase n=1 Tax=Porphyra umbilicalis TaxID=2786 RepID=A0A1X6NP04_PORUM|nr:hypothetical protein BU14_0930s0005 [Porphyra umbilicalis]|eukprot:OSX70073.1 hypothetical protein BU14_0930s0005 [Porphyra umbilicalis]
MPFSVGVRESLMIAHSFKGEEFGPAQRTHGATYTIDAEWSAKELVSGVNWVLNIADAADALEAVVAEWNYRNLDEVAAFDGQNTTTEFLSHAIHSALAKRLPSFVGTLKVTLQESHKAWASYTGELPPPSST